MNISTYESQIKALEAGGGGGGGGSSDGLFVITIDFDTMSLDKTFSEVKNAVLNNIPILIDAGIKTFPADIFYDDIGDYIQFQLTTVGAYLNPTPSGLLTYIIYKLSSDDALTVTVGRYFTFEITEVNA